MAEAKTYNDKIGQPFWICSECEHHSRDRRDECYNCGAPRAFEKADERNQ